MALLCWPWTLDQYDGDEQLKKFHIRLLRKHGYLHKEFMKPPESKDPVTTAVRDVMFHICDEDKEQHVVLGTDSELGLEAIAALLVCAWLLTFKSRASWTNTLELSDLLSQREWTEDTDDRISDLRNSRLIVYTNPDESDRRIEYVSMTISRFIKKHMLNPVRKTVFLMNRNDKKAFSPDEISKLLQRNFPDSMVGLIIESSAFIWRPTA